MVALRNLRRICFVIPTLDTGGTERQLVHLAHNLATDYEVTVFCTRKEGHWAPILRESGIYVRRVPCLRLPGGYCLFQTRQFCRLFRNHRPDILHTFLFGFDLPVNRAARLTGVPVIISSRRELATWQKSHHLAMQRAANTLVNGIVANSRAVADYAIRAEGLSTHRVRVIYNGVDTDAFAETPDVAAIRRELGIPERARVVGMVANFSPVKDHDLFLDMATLLAKDEPDIHFLLIGKGALKRHVQRKARKCRIHRQLKILSVEGTPPEWYYVMDVVTLCSKVEGFPNALLEAMAAARPIVATAVGGVPELITDGVHGKLITSREPAEFAAAVRLLLRDKELACRLGTNAAAHARESFSLSRMFAQYRALYNELLAQSVVLGS